MQPHKVQTAEKPLKLRTRLIINLAAFVIRIWFSTCRVNITGHRYLKRFFINDEPAVGATWHRGAVFLIWYFGRYHPIIMFSKSADGDLLAGFAAKMGVILVRGSSSRGGREALTMMARYLKRHKRGVAATVLDGPQGPQFVAKTGMVALAKLTQKPLLPVMMSAWPAITIKTAWDRTLIPLPFARVAISLAKPWDIPEDYGMAKIENLRGEVEAKLNRMMHAADAQTGYLQKWPEVYGSRVDPPVKENNPAQPRA